MDIIEAIRAGLWRPEPDPRDLRTGNPLPGRRPEHLRHALASAGVDPGSIKLDTGKDGPSVIVEAVLKSDGTPVVAALVAKVLAGEFIGDDFEIAELTPDHARRAAALLLLRAEEAEELAKRSDRRENRIPPQGLGRHPHIGNLAAMNASVDAPAGFSRPRYPFGGQSSWNRVEVDANEVGIIDPGSVWGSPLRPVGSAIGSMMGQVSAVEPAGLCKDCGRDVPAGVERCSFDAGYHAASERFAAEKEAAEPINENTDREGTR